MTQKANIRFVNESNDQNNSQVVIFQKADNDAFKMLENCEAGSAHEISVPHTPVVGASDSYGNYTPQLTSQPKEAITNPDTRLKVSVINTHAKEVKHKSDIKSVVNTEIDLLGISSADLVMSGNEKDGHTFTLKNVISSANSEIKDQPVKTSKIAQSDVPDNMLSLLTALRAR